MKRLCVLLFLASLGCAGAPDAPLVYSSFAGIEKTETVFHNSALESQPFEMDGKLYLAVWNRYVIPAQLEVWDVATNKMRNSVPFPYQFGSLIFASRFYIFGTAEDGSSIWMMQTQDFLVFDNLHEIYHAPEGTKIYNTSIAYNPDTGGRTQDAYTIAYEFARPGLVDFTVGFLQSGSFGGWTERPETFSPDQYLGCPTLRYSDGTFKLFYLRSRGGTYSTFAASGATLGELTEKATVLAASGDEGINNSDMDLVEYKGKVYISYAIGDQQSQIGIKIATFNGTLKQLYKELGL